MRLKRAIALAAAMAVSGALAFVAPGDGEIIVDLFAGGGGASEGIKQATGRDPDVAVNHDPEAVALHMANHPDTLHFVENVWKVDPVVVCNGRPVGLLWASPDCKHFSKAKGGKPVSDRVRGLAWIVPEWAKAVRPRVIILENVEEFQTWGPLGNDGTPCKIRAGSTFRLWCRRLEKLGYQLELREIRASALGTPTLRNRLYVIARCDGEPIVWPQDTHGDPESLPVKQGQLQPWRTAAECIDFSLPCPSIFLTTAEGKKLRVKRPLVDKTCKRVAYGVMRYVINSAKPFIVSLTHQGGNRVESVDEPTRVITGAHRGEKALVSPTLVSVGYGEREGQAPRAPGLGKPLGTAVGANKHALVSAFLTEHANASMQRTFAGNEPLRTQCAQVKGGHFALVTSNIVKMRGTSKASAGDAPLHTISAGGFHHAEVRAFLIKYYGVDQDPRLTEPMHTVPTKDRFAVVMVHGDPYIIGDIGMRMLTPRELYRAQGFPESYVIDRVPDVRKLLTSGNVIPIRPEIQTWVPLTKTAQVRMCGNSVCPPVARALVAANFVARRRVLEAA